MIGLMIRQLGLIIQQLKDVSDQIDESLQQKFSRSKETNAYFEKIREWLTKVEERFMNWNKELRKLLMNSKENTDKETLVEASRSTNNEFRKINESLRKLRKRAESTINYKHYSYEEMINIHLPNLKTKEFTPNENIIRFIREIK